MTRRHTFGAVVAAAVVIGALGGAGCGPSPREMYCAPSRQMPGDDVPTYLECWDQYSHCRANSAENDQCDPKRRVLPYGFTEERQDETAELFEVQRWFASEQECERAHAEPPNGTENRSSCSAR